jgi:hypothetical protein
LSPFVLFVFVYLNIFSHRIIYTFCKITHFIFLPIRLLVPFINLFSFYYSASQIPNLAFPNTQSIFYVTFPFCKFGFLYLLMLMLMMSKNQFWKKHLGNEKNIISFCVCVESESGKVLLKKPLNSNKTFKSISRFLKKNC